MCYWIRLTSITFLFFPAFSKQLRTEGSMLEPPNDATSPNCRGSCIQSWSNRPSLRWSTNRLGSAINRKRSGIVVEKVNMMITDQFVCKMFYKNKFWTKKRKKSMNFFYDHYFRWFLFFFKLPVSSNIDSFDIYLHLYFSSRCPFDSKMIPTLKERTLTCPVLWLKQ